MPKEIDVTITVETMSSEDIPNNKGVQTIERVVIKDRMTWLAVQELVARLKPQSDL